MRIRRAREAGVDTHELREFNAWLLRLGALGRPRRLAPRRAEEARAGRGRARTRWVVSARGRWGERWVSHERVDRSAAFAWFPLQTW